MDTVDTAAASHLVRIVNAVQLLGSHVVVSGIRPAVAQTVSSLGVEWGGLTVRRNLQDALRHCLAASPQGKER